jgi:twitching motility protein PilU
LPRPAPLAISTLHANNANQALDRIINYFPEEHRNRLVPGLSLNLRAFVTQRLVKTVDGKRCAVVEILLGTPLVKEMIHKGNVHEIKEIMNKTENPGMQTFGGALYRLHKDGRIDLDETMRNADSPNNRRLRINLSENQPAGKKTATGLSLIDKDDGEDEEEEVATA